MSQHGGIVAMTRISNNQFKKHVYFMRVAEIKFERPISEGEGIQSQDLFISDRENKLRVVFDPVLQPDRVSEQLHTLIEGGQFGMDQ